MCDLLYFATKSAVCGGSFVINVRAVAEVRRILQPRISWGAIFMKAMASTAKNHPELRQCYMPFPWGHVYQHPFPVGCMVVEREWQGEHAVFFDRIKAPEQKSLRELDLTLRAMKTLPVEGLGGYRLLIRITRFPFLLRRLAWWIVLYGSGRLRSRYIGTFSINGNPLGHGVPTQSTTPAAISICYGTVAGNGDVPIQIFFNHYLIDGGQLHRLVVALSNTLEGEIFAELSAEIKEHSSPSAP